MKTQFQRASNRLMCDIGLTNELYCANSASVNIDILLLILRNSAISHEIATTVPRLPLCCGFDRWYLQANFLVCSSQPPLCTDLSRSSPSIAAEHPEQHVNHCYLNLNSLQWICATSRDSSILWSFSGSTCNVPVIYRQMRCLGWLCGIVCRNGHINWRMVHAWVSF